MNSDYVYGFLGGMLIGLSALILMWFNGRILGVSGITAGLLGKLDRDAFWRIAFIGGLIIGGFIGQKLFSPQVIVNASGFVLILAGLCVGFGTVMGNGCTSGHGICGIARLSKRSIVATIVFMLAGILTVLLKRIWGG